MMLRNPALRRAALLGALATWLPCAATLGQSPAVSISVSSPVQRGVHIDSPDEAAAALRAAAQSPANPESAPAKPSPRLEKLKKLEFDRRPSAILAAWSKPPK